MLKKPDHSSGFFILGLLEMLEAMPSKLV